MKRYSVVVFLILSLGFIIGQTQPAKSLHRNPPRTWALTNATVHTEPGKSIIWYYHHSQWGNSSGRQKS